MVNGTEGHRYRDGIRPTVKAQFQSKDRDLSPAYATHASAITLYADSASSVVYLHLDATHCCVIELFFPGVAQRRKGRHITG